MNDPLISKAEQHAYRQLFLHDLHWSAPDHTPIDYTTDGRTLTATNVSSYRGLRVWVCDEKPGSQLEAQLDREIAKTTTDRLVIFHDGVDQVWRWPGTQGCKGWRSGAGPSSRWCGCTGGSRRGRPSRCCASCAIRRR